MRSRKSKSVITGSCLIVVLILVVTAASLWVALPRLAKLAFGEPASSLNGLALRNFSVQVLRHKNDLMSPVDRLGTPSEFEISSGESIHSISTRLAGSGLINDAAGFRAYLVYKGLDSQIKAGSFQLSPSDNSLTLAEMIQSSYSPTVPFYIYPGWRAEEIAEALPTSGIEVDPEGFLEIVTNPALLTGRTEYAALSSLEGFLFPGEYEIDRKISAEDLVLTLLRRFDESVNQETKMKIEQNGFSLYEGVILASIIQRETFMDDERALMASVFYNRLANGMKLETDPTVQYALGFSEKWGSWWKTPLRTVDLKVESPYNTYIIYSLPPTPISNPALSALEAVAYPEDSTFFYFRARCDNSGYHNFSETFEEHLSKACE